MDAELDCRPPMGPDAKVSAQTALAVTGVLLAMAGLSVGAWLLLGSLIVAATGTGASGMLVPLGVAAAVFGCVACTLCVWLSMRLGRRP